MADVRSLYWNQPARLNGKFCRSAVRANLISLAMSLSRMMETATLHLMQGGNGRAATISAAFNGRFGSTGVDSFESHATSSTYFQFWWEWPRCGHSSLPTRRSATGPTSTKTKLISVQRVPPHCLNRITPVQQRLFPAQTLLCNSCPGLRRHGAGIAVPGFPESNRKRNAVMKSKHVHLLFYPQPEIKPRLRGHLIYVLEIPRIPGLPVLRQIYDQTGKDFPPLPHSDLFSIAREHGDCIAFMGVSKDSVFDVMTFDPPLSNDDSGLDRYKRDLLRNARNFFLATPDSGRQCDLGTVPERIAMLLSDSDKAVLPEHD